MHSFIKIHPNDTVAVAIKPLKIGNFGGNIKIVQDIPIGHKFSLCDINKGDLIIKYGYPIGRASENIKKGEWVHTHNLSTDLSDLVEYIYNPQQPEENLTNDDCSELFFYGYEREGNKAGIRQEIWIIPTVGCVNKTAEIIAQQASVLFSSLCDGVFAFCHPYGCSQLGEDHTNTQKILKGLANNPNASGVLLLSLGCENNNLQSFMPLLDSYDKTRIKTLITQEVSDEIKEGIKLVGELAKKASQQKRVKLSISKLTIGFKCGGSDAFSGITANPLCGKLTDLFTKCGGSAILTEVPEMFGAETILMNRAKNKAIFDLTVNMINDFKSYYKKYDQVIYENPSPGNKQGGITTLEEKSLGCIQKGGTATITDVLSYGDSVVKSGLNLLTGPGNDIVSCTAMAAAGANIILFTTGRGTPLGSPVPTIKISSNTALSQKKPAWIDFDAGSLLYNPDFLCLADDLLAYVIEVANGKQAKNEQAGYREIAIHKDGVTL